MGFAFSNVVSLSNPKDYLYGDTNFSIRPSPAHPQRATISQIVTGARQELNETSPDKALISHILIQVNARHEQKYSNYPWLCRMFCSFSSAIKNYLQGSGFVSSGSLLKNIISDFKLLETEYQLEEPSFTLSNEILQVSEPLTQQAESEKENQIEAVSQSKGFSVPVDVLEELDQWALEPTASDENRSQAVEEIKTGTFILVKLQLNKIPEAVGRLTWIIELNVGKNQLKTIPASIGQLKQLEFLNLFQNALTELPESLGELGNLVHLNADNNRLTEVPDSMRGLKRLRDLFLRSNHLKVFPKAIESMTRLERIDLNDNRIEILPKSLINLTSLQYLDVMNNPFGPESFWRPQGKLYTLFMWGPRIQLNPFCKLFIDRIPPPQLEGVIIPIKVVAPQKLL